MHSFYEAINTPESEMTDDVLIEREIGKVFVGFRYRDWIEPEDEPNFYVKNYLEYDMQRLSQAIQNYRQKYGHADFLDRLTFLLATISDNYTVEKNTTDLKVLMTEDVRPNILNAAFNCVFQGLFDPEALNEPVVRFFDVFRKAVLSYQDSVNWDVLPDAPVEIVETMMYVDLMDEFTKKKGDGNVFA